MAAMQAGFGHDFGYTPVPGVEEELAIALFPLQKPTTADGVVLQQDDVARFVFPLLAGPVGLFLDRPASASSLRVQFFDESEQTVVEGDEVQCQLGALVEVAKKIPCQARFPTVRLNVKVKSANPPDVSSVGQVNPYPINFAGRQGEESDE